MANKITNVPAASGGGKQESYATTKGYVTKHSGAGGFKTIGSAAAGTTDGGSKLETAPAVSIGSRQDRRASRSRK